MLYFRYDKTFEGLLTAVFDAYARRQFPEGLLGEEEPVPLFGEVALTVVTDTAKADRVWKGLGKHISASARSIMSGLSAFLSTRIGGRIGVRRITSVGRIVVDCAISDTSSASSCI